MDVSDDAKLLFREIHELRDQRRSRLERDLHFIDAEYDRCIRRIRFGEFRTTSIWTTSLTAPVCLRRRCRSGLKRLRRAWIGR